MGLRRTQRSIRPLAAQVRLTDCRLPDVDANTDYSGLALRSSGKADNAGQRAEKSPTEIKEAEAVDHDNDSLQATPTERRALLRKVQARSAPPFIASHDIPRGLLFAFQALLAYILMLAVMCV